MIEWSQPDWSPLRGLFDPDLPNHPLLFASLAGRVPARALVDRTDRPSQCVLRTSYGPTWISRTRDPGFVAGAIQELRKGGIVILVADRDDESLPQPDNTIPRLAYADLDPGADRVIAWLKKTPEDCRIREMDRGILERCRWKEEVLSACGTLDPFLEHGLGLCLMRNETILCEAYGLFWADEVVEIGAITHKGHRGKGLAPITCAHLVQACGVRGYRTYWSCHVSNHESQVVAHKLGYRSRTKYTWLVYNRRE